MPPPLDPGLTPAGTAPIHPGARVERVRSRTYLYSLRPALASLGGAVLLFVVVSVVLRKLSPGGFVAVLAVSGPIGTYFLSLRRRVKLVIDDRGVTFSDRGTVQFCSWEDAHALYYTSGTGLRSQRFELHKLDQVLLAFEDEVEDWSHAVHSIERRIGARLYPWIRDRLEKGETVSFGTVQVARNHVRVGAAAAAWDQVRVVHVGELVRLISRGTNDVLAEVPQKDVPNIALLMRITTEVDRDSKHSKLRPVADRG